MVGSFCADMFGPLNVGVGVFWLKIVVFAMKMLLIVPVKVFKILLLHRLRSRLFRANRMINRYRQLESLQFDNQLKGQLIGYFWNINIPDDSRAVLSR